MAIIKCPECGKKVSDQAANCVHCGYPLAGGTTKEEAPREEPRVRSEAKPGKGKGKLFVILAVLAVAVVAAVLLLTGVPGKKRVQVAVGEYITFGTYPQTEEGTDRTPIEWLVLDVQENKALVISRYGLDAKPYNTENKDFTWETCSLRAWLNGEFLDKAFSLQEQFAILLTEVDNSAGQGYSRWNTSGGNNTRDKIFLLSYAEANRYLGVKYWEEEVETDNTTSYLVPTAYAVKTGVWPTKYRLTAEGTVADWWWWLRSPGVSRSYAAYVYIDGSLDGAITYRVDGALRPAFWLNLESDIF